MLKKGFISNNHKQSDNRVLSGVMKFLIIILAIVIIVAIFLFVTQLKDITIEGNNHYSNEEIINLTRTKEIDRNTLLFYLGHRFVENKEIPFIEKIDITLTDKNSVHLQVYEKIITGTVEYMESYMYFDREGIIAETSSERIEGIPLVKGLEFSKLILNAPIEVDRPGIFQTILNLTQLIHGNEIKVDTIYFTHDLEVILYSDNVRVLLGRRDSYDEQIAQLPNLFASLETQKAEIVDGSDNKLVIDMREFKEGQDKIIGIPID